MAIVTRLIQPSEIVIQQLDLSSTLFDEDAREPVHQARYSTAISPPLEAQVSWTKATRTSYKFTGQGGRHTESVGYLVFLKRELEAAGVTLQAGDRVTSIAGETYKLYLQDSQKAGHSNNNPNLKFWFMTDKRPSS